MSLTRSIIWFLSAVLAFLCMSFFFLSVVHEGGKDAAQYLIGAALGTAGVIAAAVMED